MTKHIKKRANGTGGVTYLGEGRRRPFMAYITTEGKKNIIGYAESYHEACSLLDNDLRTPERHQKPDVSLRAIYSMFWYHKSNRIGDSLKSNFKASWGYVGILGDFMFSRLSTEHFQKVIDDNAHLSSSSLQKIKLLCSELYKYAIANHYASINYAEFIELPRRPKTKRRAISETELRTIYNKAEDNYILQSLLILLYSGFRVQALLDLTPEDYSPSFKTITGGNKTEAGRNLTQPVHPKIIPYIENFLAYGGNRLITDTQGNPIQYRTYLNRIKRELAKLGITDITPHCTKCTLENMFRRAGVDHRVSSAFLGHSDPSITAKHYNKPTLQDLTDAIDRI